MRIKIFSNKSIIRNLCTKLQSFQRTKKPAIFIEHTPDTFNSTALRPNLSRINTPIANDEEYTILLNKLVNTLGPNGNPVFFTKYNLRQYSKIDFKEYGLIPYCGQDDCSRLINMYLSNRLTEKEPYIWTYKMPSDLDTMPEIIRLLEYSLKALDKKHGQYRGIVYRQGFMSEKPNHYISTSIDPYIAANFNIGPYKISNGEKPFSIIQVENGHKISEFQKEAGSAYADSELEILLSFKNNYTKLEREQLSKELFDAKKHFASILYKDALLNSKINFLPKEKWDVTGYTEDDIFNLIDVYIQK